MTDPILPLAALQGSAVDQSAQVLAPTALVQPAVITPNAGQAVLLIEQPKPFEVFSIDTTPAMPSIQCRARIGGVKPDPTPTVPFNWRIEIIEPPSAGTCPSAGVKCAAGDQAFGVVGGAWTPSLTTFQGGDVRIKATATMSGNVLEAEVRVLILGKNPAPRDVYAMCGGRNTDMGRILCHESGLRQFGDNGYPKLGRGGDVGISQLCLPAASCEQRWNWRANVMEGIRIFGLHKAAARAYLDGHKADGKWPNERGMTDEQVLQREAMQRYNGKSYWIWDEIAGLWKVVDKQKYPDVVLAHTDCP
ncbi:hypothetical protein [Streptomyces sp. XD-27]|uniref:hypothetical protein n=1 Tax=Streptomyces sp. XD-27 TaxID=3062779 RepID=UPI0026F46E5C|nr:hypothetical protein [Streptomyces sp. XD-27]WKX69577.1 hypothetical protein Q3Y56_06330 [Streptomyces sp. XD-27]